MYYTLPHQGQSENLSDSFSHGRPFWREYGLSLHHPPLLHGQHGDSLLVRLLCSRRPSVDWYGSWFDFDHALKVGWCCNCSNPNLDALDWVGGWIWRTLFGAHRTRRVKQWTISWLYRDTQWIYAWLGISASASAFTLLFLHMCSGIVVLMDVKKTDRYSYTMPLDVHTTANPHEKETKFCVCVRTCALKKRTRKGIDLAFLSATSHSFSVIPTLSSTTQRWDEVNSYL